jgi:hypothetical protein
MEKPDTSPLRSESGAIIIDGVQGKLDAARRRYRISYDKGFSLSERGHPSAQSVLDAANSELLLAERAYARARGRG